MTNEIACYNQEDRVGKTTTDVDLEIDLANACKKELLVDADPQGCLVGS